jgi:uncharacterized membrane protein
MPVNEEDRILRVWTPVLLRTVLIAASIMLVVGLTMMATHAPNYYVDRYKAVRSGRFHDPETFDQLLHGITAGDSHSIMTMGLFVLTLVPLGRVAFCFLLFIKERDLPYVGFTAYVLAGLIAGVLLGRIG